VIASEELFHGTLSQTSVYPREVVKRALAHNAAAVILAHNHPSGVAEPSQSDRLLTDALKQALSLVDVRVLDHFVVAVGTDPVVCGKRVDITRAFRHFDLTKCKSTMLSRTNITRVEIMKFAKALGLMCGSFMLVANGVSAQELETENGPASRA